MSTSLEKIIGGYLFIEGWASIENQRGLSNIGKLGRIGIVKNTQYGYF